MVDITIITDRVALKRAKEKLGQVDEDLNKLNFRYAKEIEKSMRRQLISQTKKAPRHRSASQIRAVRLSKYRSAIKMPLKLIYLDRMKPHYVSLKRGRMITKWAQKYYNGTPQKTGRSRVRTGPRGGIKGFLYVTPDPFVRKAILKVDDWLRAEVNRIFRR